MLPLQVLISGLLLLLPVWTTTVTSSPCPCVSTSLENIVNVFDGMFTFSFQLLPTSLHPILECRHRKKKSLESSVVFHGFQNEVFQSTAQPQAVDNVYIIKGSQLPVAH
eukprot:NP_001156825.1 developmental pluripotency associated 1 family member protein precursor [Mus musculus]